MSAGTSLSTMPHDFGQVDEPTGDEGMDDTELLALVEEELRSAICFDNDDDKDSREKALEYERGEMRNDVDHVEGWSKMVSLVVQETVDLAMPGVMRVFDAPDIASFMPQEPGDEESAADASTYVNYLWDHELEGYNVLETAVRDALVVRNGIIKHYWDHTPIHTTEEMCGLDQQQFMMVANDPDCKMLGVAAREVHLGTEPTTGEPITIFIFDVRVRRTQKGGRLVLENVPPEDFGISSDAKSGRLSKARCVWHRMVKTKSDLIKEGHDRDVIDEIPSGVSWSSVHDERNDDSSFLTRGSQGKGALEEVEIYEVYLLADLNGDGVAERVKVLAAGGAGGRKILEREEWTEDDLPFTDLKALAVPHRWMGRSLADSTMDLQRVSTVICRQFMDNLFQVNRPGREVVERNIVSPAELLRPRPGQVVRVREPNSIRNLDIQFIGDKALMGLAYVDKLIARRTGIAESTAALDETAIDPQTATAEQIEHDANYARTEWMVRSMAKNGLKELFSNILRLVVRHQDRPRQVRLKEDWKTFDPRPWNALMDVKIKIGLGTGSRERDLAMMNRIAVDQKDIVLAMGPDNPIVTAEKFVGTRHKMVTAAGLDNPEEYYADVTDEEWNQYLAAKQANKPPDPKVQEAQAKLQIQDQANQAKVAQDQQKMQTDLQIEAAKGQANMQIEAAKGEAKMQLERQQMAQDAMLKREEMQLEAQLKGMQILADQEQQAATAVEEPD